MNKTTQEAFDLLASKGLITRNGQTWELTPAGRAKGGVYKEHAKYGKYIAWPESIREAFDERQPEPGRDEPVDAGQLPARKKAIFAIVLRHEGHAQLGLLAPEQRLDRQRTALRLFFARLHPAGVVLPGGGGGLFGVGL